jgi:PKD repeat protein
LATGQLAVAHGSFAVFAQVHVPPDAPALMPVPFAAMVNASNIAAEVVIDWDFGDATRHATNAYATHIYTVPGTYVWKLIASCSDQSASNSGSILVDPPVFLSIAPSGSQIVVSWALSSFDLILDHTGNLDSGPLWQAVTNAPIVDTQNNVRLDVANPSGFFRLRR